MDVYNWFQNKKVLIFIPHPDDEINLAGAFISSLTEVTNADVYVVFFTTGDYCGSDYIRFYESTNAMRVLGIKKDKIIYMGYPEAEYDKPDLNNTFYSKRARYVSYERKNHKEYCYRKEGKHKEITIDNIVKDIENIILDISPDILLCNWQDMHPAHISLSALFDRSVEALLQAGYKYTILRGYCYDTAWNAPKDFYSMNLKSTSIKDDSSITLEQWNNRIRFPVVNSCRQNRLLKNKVAKALTKHKSQRAIKNAEGIINNDCVFWYDDKSLKDISPFSKVLFGNNFVYDGNSLRGDSDVLFGLYYFNGMKPICLYERNLLDIHCDNPKVIISKDSNKLFFKKGFKEAVLSVKYTEECKDTVRIIERKCGQELLYRIATYLERKIMNIHIYCLNMLYRVVMKLCDFLNEFQAPTV